MGEALSCCMRRDRTNRKQTPPTKNSKNQPLFNVFRVRTIKLGSTLTTEQEFHLPRYIVQHPLLPEEVFIVYQRSSEIPLPPNGKYSVENSSESTLKEKLCSEGRILGCTSNLHNGHFFLKYTEDSLLAHCQVLTLEMSSGFTEHSLCELLNSGPYSFLFLLPSEFTAVLYVSVNPLPRTYTVSVFPEERLTDFAFEAILSEKIEKMNEKGLKFEGLASFQRTLYLLFYT